MPVTKLKEFMVVLQSSIRSSDKEWAYKVQNLPSAATVNHSQLVKSVRVLPDSKEQAIVLRYTNASSNRATKGEPLDKFVYITFADFRLRHPASDSLADVKNETTTVPATHKESTDYVVRLLQAGMVINGVQYNFYGHSNSQLKSRSCVLWAASKIDISQKIEGLGDCSKMKTVGKKAKRIGLLFSVAEVACDVAPDQCEDIPDVTKDDYNFTDGCGLISEQFAKILAKMRNVLYRNQRYIPSVYQLRYRGYKRVVMVDPSMKGKIKLNFRDSMKKFKGGDELSFSVVDYSKVKLFIILRWRETDGNNISPTDLASSMIKSCFCYSPFPFPTTFC